MKLKEIIETACALLGFDEPYADNADYPLVVRCANLTVSELALEYAPVTYEEVTETDNGLIFYGSLSRNYAGLVAVESESGEVLKSVCYPDYVKTSPGKVIVRYNFIPPKLAEDDDVPLGCPKFASRLVSYGTAAEYCLIAGRFDEAVIFNNKYTAALKAALFRPAGRVAERSWQ